MRIFSQTYMLFLLVGSLLLASCTKKAVATTTKTDTSKVNSYQEDLSAVRPKYRTETNATPKKQPDAAKNTGKPETQPVASSKKMNGEITDKLNTVLDTIAVRNKVIKSAPGFRVQVYVGDSREEALAARAKSYNILKDETPYLIPMLPSYRVRVGDFLDKLEAQKAYTLLLKEFPNALVVPDKIEIKRYHSEEEK